MTTEERLDRVERLLERTAEATLRNEEMIALLGQRVLELIEANNAHAQVIAQLGQNLDRLEKKVDQLVESMLRRGNGTGP